MRSLIRHKLIAIGLATLVITAFAGRPGLQQNALARSAAVIFKKNAPVISALRENREGFVEVFGPTTQIGTVSTPTVSPNSVNVYSQGATSVLLTFSGVINMRPLDATFCSELVPVFSGGDPIGANLGFKCKPGTSFGSLPPAYDQSTLSGNNTFTDILSITPQIARRAYLEAARGKTSTLFYVRQFRSNPPANTANRGAVVNDKAFVCNSCVRRVNSVDVGVPVTLHLTGNGAGVPFSLTEVKLDWVGDANPILFLKTGEKLPPFEAQITHTGTGNLTGDWELVKPGDIPPEPRDLLTEAALPSEERGTHRRYPVMSRFNVYVPPTGYFVLPGPEVEHMATSLDGLYQIVLHIDATDDPSGTTPAPGAIGESKLATALRRVPRGGVAGFSFPTLRYYVSNGSVKALPATITSANPLSLSPEDRATLDPNHPVDFTWPLGNAAKYRFEVEDLQGTPIISAILPAGVGSYRAPSWFKGRVGKQIVRWRVIFFDQKGEEIDKTEWRALRFVP